MVLRIKTTDDSVQQLKKTSSALRRIFIDLRCSSVGDNLEKLREILDVVSLHLKTNYTKNNFQ